MNNHAHDRINSFNCLTNPIEKGKTVDLNFFSQKFKQESNPISVRHSPKKSKSVSMFSNEGKQMDEVVSALKATRAGKQRPNMKRLIMLLYG